MLTLSSSLSFFFFFNDTATTEIYTLSLHDALPISGRKARRLALDAFAEAMLGQQRHAIRAPQHARLQPQITIDRKSTRLNSSHRCISYAVFCLKKKNSMSNISGEFALQMCPTTAIA